MARHRSTHLVAVVAVAVAVAVAAVPVAGCLGLAATERKKTAYEAQKQLSQKKSAFSFLPLLFPHVRALPEADQRRQQPKKCSFLREHL